MGLWLGMKGWFGAIPQRHSVWNEMKQKEGYGGESFLLPYTQPLLPLS